MSVGEQGTAATVGWMALFVVVGAPFVYLIWEFINESLAGRFSLSTTGLAAVGVVGLVAVLKFVARRAEEWESADS